MEDPSAHGWRLLKANVALNTNGPGNSDEEQWQSHPAEIIVAAQLLELIERESARRFVVHCGQKSGLLVHLSPRYCVIYLTNSVIALGVQPGSSLFQFQFRTQCQCTTSYESALSDDRGCGFGTES